MDAWQNRPDSAELLNVYSLLALFDKYTLYINSYNHSFNRISCFGVLQNQLRVEDVTHRL